MEVTAESLRERYRLLSTDELAELEAHGALTETAQRVLEEVLAERGGNETARAREEAQQACIAAIDAPAPLGDRFAAQFVDGLIALMVTFALFFAGGWLAPTRALAGSVILFGVVCGLGYLWLSDGLRGGQSFGKRLFRIAVVHAVKGEPCTFGQSLVRNATLSFLGVVDLIPLMGRERRRVGDHLARTRVVKVAPPRAVD